MNRFKTVLLLSVLTILLVLMGNASGGLVMAFVAPTAAMLIQMAVSRSREYMADALGAEISSKPLVLTGALQKFFSTHPPMEARIARLQSMALQRR